MKNEPNYTAAPAGIEESLTRADIVPNFELSPEGIKAFAAKRAKKPVSIYLTVETIEKFKKAAEQSGERYQTLIRDVLDGYSQQYM
jgi:predicted DNA binding CopG/RHH family protein